MSALQLFSMERVGVPTIFLVHTWLGTVLWKESYSI